ncbi:MAG: type II toxin-antitoxin system Phd/YefM family antitoxin [Treponema sp.]|jgi:antitoxin (DNA-binding transcriptional repressor) of toxin-antitoxin stability system|nr:type II toxin-antitoxin system Phd/YefM family antitoxin [Treponema sp.]
MEYLSVRELSTSSKGVWKKLDKEGEVVITNNGRPTAIMISVNAQGFDETAAMIRQARCMRLLNSIWEEAEQRGPLSDEEIEAEIQAARKKSKAKSRCR